MAKKSAKKKKKPVMKKKAVKKTTKKSKTKSKKVLAIPHGYHNLTPYLIVNDANRAIEFYKQAFGAKEKMRMNGMANTICHAELQIGDSKVMLADECIEMDARSPRTVGGSPVGIHLYIKDVDAIVKRAVAAGAKLVKAVENMFWGDRAGCVIDPYGHKWHISTHVEDVKPTEMKKRMAEWMKKMEFA